MMNIFTSDTTTQTKTCHQLSLIWQRSRLKNSPNLNESHLLLQILENLQDGILIIDLSGEVIHANANAKKMCLRLNNQHKNYLPQSIWQLCESLLETSQELSTVNMMIADEIQINHQESFRISVRLLELEGVPTPYLLATIENRSESVKNIAIAEIKQYHLTPREAEIWHLYRANQTYKNIASQLYITVNTVKKHMKNIHAKRQAFLASRQC